MLPRGLPSDLLQRHCNSLPRIIGSLILATSIGVWIVAFAMIEKAANTPEHADKESQRTSWSSKRAAQIGRWGIWQSSLAREAQAYQPASPYDARSRLVLLGDSITEAWRGTSYGDVVERASGVPQVLDETLGRRWPEPLVLGISGDQTQHVLWRLSHGEVSARMAVDDRLCVVLLIGTNNLAAGHSPEQVADGINAIARRLLNHTRAKVLLHALLPRADNVAATRARSRSGKPLHSFRPLIDRVNALLNRSAARLAAENPGRVRFVDCGRVFTPFSKPSTRFAAGGGGGGGGPRGVSAVVNSASGLIAARSEEARQAPWRASAGAPGLFIERA